MLGLVRVGVRMAIEGRERVTIWVTPEQRQLLDQEMLRLREQYKIILTKAEIVQLLIEIHRLRLQSMATETSDAQWWKYQNLVDDE